MLHRIEALPRAGQYALAVLLQGGHERTIVAAVEGGAVSIATADIPSGWSVDSESYKATVAAVLAVDHARNVTPAPVLLQDVAGGWDVSLGNIVLSQTGPLCTADGPLEPADGDTWACPVCGAQALYRG
jgi:hypothetical protein